MSLPFLLIVPCTGLVSALLIVQTTPSVDEVRKTNHLLARIASFWEEDKEDSLALFTAILPVSTCHLQMQAICTRALCRCPPSNGANGNDKHATIEGKTGPVETRLTRLAALALTSVLKVSTCTNG